MSRGGHGASGGIVNIQVITPVAGGKWRYTLKLLSVDRFGRRSGQWTRNLTEHWHIGDCRRM